MEAIGPLPVVDSARAWLHGPAVILELTHLDAARAGNDDAFRQLRFFESPSR